MLVWLAATTLPAQGGPCGSMFVHAHRGAHTHPENSLSAIVAALRGPWDGVEIDAYRLGGDQTWVVHHDPILGRVTSHPGRLLKDMTASAWAEVRLKDRQGRLTEERAAFLEDVLAESAKYPHKVLNIEAKGGVASCSGMAELANLVKRHRPDGNWFITGIQASALECVRKVDRDGYLGVIALDMHALAQSTAFTRNRQVPAQVQPRKLSASELQATRRSLGAPSGYHVDTITLAANPTLLADARQAGMAVVTYHLGQGSDRDHARMIRDARARTGLLPSGAVIDGDPVQFCGQALR